jgi:hypothetical protein
VMRSGSCVVCAALCLLAGCTPQPPTPPGLEGVWEVRNYRTVTPTETEDVPETGPSVVIFTRGHYAQLWIPDTNAMRSYAEVWQPTDAEKVQRYGEFIVNAGTYTRSDSILLTRPSVSRAPELVDGSITYGFHVKADTLWLTTLDEHSRDNVQAPWAAAGIRNTLVLERVEKLGGQY